MLFYCLCMDKPNRNDLRMATRSKHIEYNSGFRDRILIGGPILSEDNQTMIGTFFVLEVPDRGVAEAHFENDPYFKADLFESVVIRPFRKTLP